MSEKGSFDIKIFAAPAAIALGAFVISYVGMITHGCEKVQRPADGAGPVASAPITSNRSEAELWAVCSACHQADGAGKPGVAPGLNNQAFLAAVSDDFLYKTIAEGRPGTSMLAFKTQMSEQELQKMVKYVRAWQKVPALELDHSRKLAGDPKAGGELYDSMCGKCHGPNGEGYAAGGSGTAIRNPAFLSVASDAYLESIIARGRPGTPMKGFRGPDGLGNLSDEEIGNVVAYLRSTN